MAAGLPVVVSDWNGYKDTVRHGLDGFRIPTIAPSSSLSDNINIDFASGVIDYDQYLGITSLQVTVSALHAVKAFEKLFVSRDLRKTMGENGQKRVKSHYDWNVIVPQYDRLWSELSDRRNANKGALAISQNVLYPSRPHPFLLFEHYPTNLLDVSTKSPYLAFRSFFKCL